MSLVIQIRLNKTKPYIEICITFLFDSCIKERLFSHLLNLFRQQNTVNH